jgi:outer membrane receptor protein involved in Fe transport
MGDRQKAGFAPGIILGFSAAFAATAVSAQTSGARPAATAAEAPAAMQEIIVTARKRQESILKVPVVMTAVTEQQLEAYSTHDLFTVANRVPGLLVGTSLAANGLQVSMRGIGTTANNATVDNSISLNVDGLQLSQGLAYTLGMFDVGQVEVLKGPQALFYGKNSPAGVISLRSADPTNTVEMIARAGYEFEAREKTGEFIVSGPVTDTLKLRLAAKYSDQDGFFRNTVQVLPNSGSVNPDNRRVTPTKDFMLRGTALFNGGEHYDARFKASYENLDQQGTWPNLQPGYCPEGTGGVPPKNVQFIGGDCKVNRDLYAAWPGTGFTGLRNNAKPFNYMRQMLVSLDQNVKLTDGLTLSSVSGFYQVRQKYLFLAGFATSVPLVSDSDFHTHQWTQEFRLASDFKGPVNFTAGAYYQNASQETDVLLKGNTVLGLPAISQWNQHNIFIKSLSFFGQVRWKITPDLELAPGGRWTHETRYHRQYNYFAGSGPLGRSVLLDPRVASKNFSPEVTLTYTPTDDLTAFAAYKTGFKSGSFNGTIFAAPTTPASFGDEKANGVEGGVKSRLMDHQLALNAAVYYYRYRDLQVGAGEIRGATIINRTLNAASAKVYGLDFDATYSPMAVPGLNVQAAVNYNHARYGSFPNAPCGNGQTISQGCDQLKNPTTGLFSAQDLSGRVLVRAPTWMGTLGADYERPVSDKLAVHAGAFVTYSSKYSLNLTDLPGFTQPAYAKLNATVTLKDISDAWEISLIGNNLTNKITSANCFNSNLQNGSFFGGQIQGGPLPGPAGGDEANCVAERGRELWIRVTVRPMAFAGR